MGIPRVGNKDINKILRKAAREGWRIPRSVPRGGHLKCYSPDGTHIVVVSVSPRDKSSTKKVKCDFRRGGLEL